jgi:hypothetical protein
MVPNANSTLSPGPPRYSRLWLAEVGIVGHRPGLEEVPGAPALEISDHVAARDEGQARPAHAPDHEMSPKRKPKVPDATAVHVSDDAAERTGCCSSRPTEPLQAPVSYNVQRLATRRDARMPVSHAPPNLVPPAHEAP